MKLFLFLLLLTSSLAQDDYSDDDYIGPAKTEKIIFKLNIYPEIEDCYLNTNKSSLTLYFEANNYCNCYNHKKYDSCFHELIQSSEFKQYNWSHELLRHNISYFNIDQCLVNTEINPNMCFNCSNNTLFLDIDVPKDMCIGVYIVGTILILLFIIVIIAFIYFCINLHKYEGYQNLNDGLKRKFIFFKK